MDIRTYPDELARLRSENERLTHELGQCASENNQLAENAAELGKALDVCIAERDEAYRDLDAQTLKANSFRRELHRYMQHAIELKDMLDASVAERDQAFAELDAERNAHNATAAQLYAKLDAQAKRHADVIERWKVEENTWHEFDKNQVAQINALRAELDAMRQAHSVVAARMQAMGC